MAHLEAEIAALRAEVKALRKQVALVLARQHERTGPLRKASPTRRQPPSPAGPTRKPRRQRSTSGRKGGGQRGHPGSPLPLVAQPDEGLAPRPAGCTNGQQP